MKKIILITNKLFQYRIEVYNYFSDKFKENNFELFVIANKIQKNIDIEINFKYKLLPFKKYLNEINIYNPDVAITFLNLSHLVIWPTIHYLRFKKIPFIYWGHGVNLQDPNNKLKNKLFYYIHNISDSIILYSEDQIQHINSKNRNKIFIANNTLNFYSFPQIQKTKSELREELKISFKKVVLFVGRILPNKRIDILIDIFLDSPKHFGLIIIGDGLPKEYQEKIKGKENIIYVGGIYNVNLINKYFKLSDIFCIPGANGLGINQAMHWGVPCLTIEGKHSPEIMYVINGKTGFIEKNKEELKKRIFSVLNNDNVLMTLSNNAYQHIREQGSIDNMANSFINAINYCIKE